MSDLFDYAVSAPKMSAPFVKGSDTSEASAKRIEPALGYLQQKVLDVLRDAPKGMLCEEVERKADLSHQTASARIRELCQRGYIEDSGQRRQTRYGRQARVYVTREVRP